MDNASIHRSIKFNKSIKENNIKVIYNIPYHSKFNPIEYFFSILRKEIQDKKCKNEKDINDCINNFIKNINNMLN